MGSVILDHTPAEVIRIALAQLGLGTYGSAYGDWPVFTEMEPNEPDNTITTIDIEGVHQGRNMMDGEAQENQGVRIRVRGVADTNGSGRTPGSRIAYKKISDIVRALNQSVWNYLIAVPDEVGTGTTLYTLHAATLESTKIRVGRQRNNSERYLYTVDYLMALTQN